MAETTGLVTFKGNPITLVGTPVKVGDTAPEFSAHKGLLDRVSLSEAKGKVVIVTAAPSVDTGVCAKQLRAFNEQATALGDDVEVWYVTRDLVFALNRFCGAEGIERVRVLSDAVDRSFGAAWGLVMKELGLLARSTFVVNRDGVITYAEIVPEMIEEPNYDAAIAAAKAAL